MEDNKLAPLPTTQKTLGDFKGFIDQDINQAKTVTRLRKVELDDKR